MNLFVIHLKNFKKNRFVCLTSLFDGTPNVLGEAISYKIPCIAPKMLKFK